MLPDSASAWGARWRSSTRLNAPDGAGCSLTIIANAVIKAKLNGLNAPDGAGCSLTRRSDQREAHWNGLNAPDGAGCSLTQWASMMEAVMGHVLMHLMVLGAP